MTAKSSAIFLSALALLPLAATTAKAGRRTLATQKPAATEVTPSDKKGLFDLRKSRNATSRAEWQKFATFCRGSIPLILNSKKMLAAAYSQSTASQVQLNMRPQFEVTGGNVTSRGSVTKPKVIFEM